MTEAPAQEKVDALLKALRIETPVIAVYDSEDTQAFRPLVKPGSHNCCFAYYTRWLKGDTLVLTGEGKGCPGGLFHLGLRDTIMPSIEYFLTCGTEELPGEGLKASPEIAAEWLDKHTRLKPRSGHVLIGPLKLDQWDSVKTLSFFVDPDRLSALTTLSGYWSTVDMVVAPFGSGCSMLWGAVEEYGGEKAVVGGTDIAMRRHLPPDTLAFTVSPQLFHRMVNVPPGSFLDCEWWATLMKEREKQRKRR
ncbi:MAG: DUF169 domain-containing protein [Chloroflexota bacterium]|nr:DUF169 domain-containing protein [Chloroflexota bacterium]